MSPARITTFTFVLFGWTATAAAQTLPPGVEKPADASEVFVIWPGQPPGTTATGQPEQVTQAMGGPAGRWVRNVEVPTLTAFLPDPADATGAAVVVAPSGAFLFLNIDHDGFEVARWFAERGVAAFVLRYRVRPTSRDPTAFADQLRQVLTAAATAEGFSSGQAPWPYAADDGRQAIRIVRERAGHWSVDPGRVGIVGFSAGGFVVNDVAAGYDEVTRPDFAATIAAGLRESVTVPDDAPPLFIAYAVDDPFMSRHMLPLFTTWQDAGRPVEMHAYESGGHDLGLNARWIDAFSGWLAHHGLISEAK
jgi:acetyl esterase/lipase